jgi:hypothetical protein
VQPFFIFIDKQISHFVVSYYKLNFMEETKVFIGFLQSSIAPIALISGVGLILLSLTNRLGRTIDRTRALLTELRTASGKRINTIKLELVALHRRNKVLKVAMGGIAFSILTSSLIIPVLLAMNVLAANIRILGEILLVLSISGIVLAAAFLFVDVVLSLKALNYEMEELLG